MSLQMYCFGWFVLAVLCPATSNPVVVTRRIYNGPSYHLPNIQDPSYFSEPINFQREIHNSNHKNNYKSVDVTNNVDGKKPESFKITVPDTSGQQVRDASSDGVQDYHDVYSSEKNHDGQQPPKQLNDGGKLNHRLISSTEEPPHIVHSNNNDEPYYKANKLMEEPAHTEPVHKKIIAQQSHNQMDETLNTAPVNNRPLYKAIFKDKSCYKTHRETNNDHLSKDESSDEKRTSENEQSDKVKTYYYTGSRGYRTEDGGQQKH